MVIRDTNISGDLEEKRGKNIWWKPSIDKKEFKKLCVKRSMPGIIYTSLYFLALILFALSQANTKAEMITPINTAKAKLCKTTVIKVTKIITKISDLGILLKALKLAHSKVPIATITITPTKAAIGTSSITGAPNRIIRRIVSAAIIPDNRALEPADKLTKVCAIIGHPPIP